MNTARFFSGFLFFIFLVLILKIGPVQAGKEVYPQGCPDTVKIIKLLKEGEVTDVLKELTAFNQFVPIITKPCNILVNKLYGIANLSRDPELAKLYWRSMLYLDARAEVFNLNILSYRIQSQFDRVKSEMVKEGHIKNAYSEDYIPPVYPDPRDSPRINSWKKLYHEIRLFAYSGDFNYTKSRLKDSLQAWVKRGEGVDPAFMILEGDLKTRRSSHRGESVFEASTLIQNGFEVLQHKSSVLVEDMSLKDWARRLKTRFAVAEDSK